MRLLLAVPAGDELGPIQSECNCHIGLRLCFDAVGQQLVQEQSLNTIIAVFGFLLACLVKRGNES